MSKESDSEKPAGEFSSALQPRLPANTIHDFTSPQLVTNPHPAYHQLRRDMPVCWDGKLPGWLITRYEDVYSLLRHKMLSSNWLETLIEQLPPEEQAAARPLREILTGRLLFLDDASHRRIRNLMQLAFTPKRVQMMEAFIQKTIDQLLDRALPAGEMDLIRDFALPLPSHVITAMLGLPPEDCNRFKAWTDDIYAFMGATRESVSERARRATASAQQLKGYLSDLMPGVFSADGTSGVKTPVFSVPLWLIPSGGTGPSAVLPYTLHKPNLEQSKTRQSRRSCVKVFVGFAPFPADPRDVPLSLTQYREPSTVSNYRSRQVRRYYGTQPSA